LPQLGDHARIEQPGDIQERIVERAQTNDRGDVICFNHDLRLGFVEVLDELRRRLAEILLDAGLRALQNVGFLVEQHRTRKIARGSACRQHITERPAVLVEQRPRIGDIVRHPQDVAANELGVFVEIGAGDDQGVLDRRLGRSGKQPVETAIDGDVGDDRHQHRRQHRDHRKQADDLNVQPGRGAPATARLHQLPDFADDDADQQQNGGGIDQQERHHHVAGGLDRGQARKHHEGETGRQQREADRERRHQAAQGPCLGLDERWFKRWDRSVCAGHSGTGEREAWPSVRSTTAGLMHSYHNVAELRLIRGTFPPA
jgi:hypothetical protein